MENSIKQLREQMGISQADLGSSVDVSRQTINSIENGKFDPSLPLALKSNFLIHLLNKFSKITLINRRN